MSRAGGRGYSVDYEEERDRYYDNGRRRGQRQTEEIDIDIRERGQPSRRPDFLREDYRPQGTLVVRDGPPERSRSRRRPEREYEEDELLIRRRTKDDDERGPRSDFLRGPPPRTEREDIDITISRDDREGGRRSRPRPHEVERDDIVFRQGSGDRGPPPRGVEREEIIIRETDTDNRPRRRDRSVDELDINIRRDESAGPRLRPRGPEREDIDIRIKDIERERSLPPPRRPIARETEEYVYRRRPSPPSPPRQETEEIIIRRKERSPSPVRAPTPPPPEPEPAIRRPPIVQEVITHHRHIDHGVVRVPPSPSSSPSPPPPPKRDESFEVEIRRRNARGEVITEDIKINERDRGRDRRDDDDYRRRQRSRSNVARREEDINIEIDRDSSSSYRNAVTTRENPNTVVQINVDSDRQVNNDRRVGLPVRQKPREMWTEITKDLVTQEAIETIGYRYEETEEFFYIMENLRYDDVRELVELSDDMRVSRRDRIEQIQWERQDPRHGMAPPERRPPTYLDEHTFDERIYEREVVYENGRPIRYRER